MRLRRAIPAAGLFLSVLAAPALGQRTDTIVLINGDHVTCEIKSYNLGRLTVGTDIASDISVKWNKIQSITSDKQFEIETTDGLVHYGTLAPSTPPGRLDVVSASGSETLDFMAVVRINPMFQSFWRRWTGSLDLGFNYTQANDFIQFTLNAEATFRRPTFQSSVNLSAFFTSQQGIPSSQRGSLNLLYEKFLADDWLVTGFGALDRNLDLGLELRGSIGAGYGRDFVQTNRTTFTAIAGIAGDREQPVDGTTTSNVTAVLAAKYTTFTYDFPKITFNASLAVFPYLNDSGRVRLEFNAYAKREIVKDFYLSLSLFDSFDSRDPSTQQAKNDWGPVLAIGWTF
jgi:hypothetical protein